MSHILWKAASVPVIAVAIVILAIGGSQASILPIATRLPAGTYWNLDAGFGDSELKLLNGGKYTSGGVGAVSVEGNYTLEQDEIVFAEYGPADAPCRGIPGKYRWTLTKQLLTLKVVDDPCSTRHYDWAAGEWFSKP